MRNRIKVIAVLLAFVLTTINIPQGVQAAEKAVFEDDFSGDLSSWTVMSQAGVADYSIEKDSSGSYLQLRTNETGSMRWVYMQSEYSGSDYRFDLKMRLDPVALFTYVYFRVNSPGDYYALHWNRHTSVMALEKSSGGTVQDLGCSVNGNTVGIKNKSWINVRVTVKGSEIKVYFIDMKTPAMEYNDTNVPILRGGVGVGTFTNPTYQHGTAEFDDVVIYEESDSEAFEFGGAVIPPDIEDDPIEQKASLLYNLHITESENGYFKSDKPVTRGEFADVLVRALNDKPLDINTGIYIAEDVAQNHQYASSIARVLEMQYMTLSNGLFRPDDYILYEELLKTLVCAGGYGYIAEKSGGGYPSGYINAAFRLGYSSGVSSQAGFAVTRDVMVRALYNALTAPSPEINTVGNGKIEYSADEDYSWLNKYFDVYEGKGVLEETPYASLGSGAVCVENSVTIGGKCMNIGNCMPFELLGRTVKYICCDNGSDFPYMLSIEDVTTSVKRLEARNITRFDENTRTYISDGGRSESITVSLTDTVIYNGKNAMPEDTFDYKPEYGYVEYITVPQGRNVLNIVSYHTVIVSAVDRENEKIYDKFGASPLELEDADVYITDAAGKNVTFSKIGAENTVLAVVSTDGEYAKLLLSKTRTQGNVTALSDDAVEIDGNEYEFSAQMRHKERISLNKDVIFYIDANGYAAAADFSENSVLYGFIIKSGISGSGIEKKLAVKLYMASEESISIYNCSEKLTIDAERYSDIKLAAEALVGKQSIAAIKINNDGEISEIDFPGDGDKNSLRKIKTEGYDTLYFNRQMLTFSNQFFITKNTPIVFVPEDKNDEDKYKTVYSSSAAITNDKWYTANGYCMGQDSFNADIVTLPEGGSSQSMMTYYLPVEKAVHVRNDEDSWVWRVYFMKYGTLSENYFDVDEEYLTDTLETQLSGLRLGDVICARVTVDDEIAFIDNFLYKVADGSSSEFSPENHGLSTRCIVGYAYDTDNAVLIAMREKPSDIPENQSPQKFEVLQSGSAKIYVIDTKNKTFTTGRIDDACTYKSSQSNASAVVSVMEYMRPLTILIYK